MYIKLLPFLIFAIYYVIAEGFLRKGENAKSIKREKHDKGSTFIVAFTFISSFVILIVAMISNLPIGNLQSNLLIAIGTLLMAVGLLVRVQAARTLGEYYTRTLRTQTKQVIIQNGLYSVVRHPGYFGVFIMWVGAGLLTGNWIYLLLLIAVQLTGYTYRISKEEEMLKTNFGKEYDNYISKTKRLIPFVY